MSTREIMILRNRNAQLVKFHNRIRNVVKFSAGTKMNRQSESMEHFITKCKVCYYLALQDKEFITEARFEPKYKMSACGRADVYCLDDNVAIEVTNTETTESIEKKKGYYPCDIKTVRVDASDKEIYELVKRLK